MKTINKLTKNNNLMKHIFTFNPNSNGGESLTLTTKFITNGDKITNKTGVYTQQTLSLQSYGNSASFELIGAALTPSNLRKLAKELESVEKQFKNKNN